MSEYNLKKLTITELAKINIQRKPARSVSLIILISVLAFTLFTGTFLIKSLNAGMTSLSNRMGADIIVVPQGYDSQIKGAILRGEPNSFYLDANIVEKIKQIEGVKLASPQLFIATLSAGCCSFPIQIIGIDFKTDFNIKPWLKSQVKLPLKDNQIVVGHNIMGTSNCEVKFFNQPFKITGKLNATGMGFDNSIFMTLENAKRLAKEYERIMQHPVAHNENLISSVMIRIKPGYKSKLVARKIRKEFKDQQIYPILSQKMMTNISASIESLNVYIYVLIVILWILSFIVLLLSFYAIFNERKPEFAMLRIIGTTKKNLSKLAVAETFMISSIGAIIGTIFGILIIVLFNQAIINGMKMPFLNPSFIWTSGLTIFTIIIISIIGPISSLKIIYNFNKKEPALSIKENF